MGSLSFDELFPMHLESLCTDIHRVYHLDSTDALNTLYKTNFYSCLSSQESGLWKLDSNTLFSLYQDEIEYGRLVSISPNGISISIK